jgi:hypothetical protein
MSLGAWAGLMSLIRNPSYWAKTEHGVSLSDAEACAAVPVGYMQTEPLAKEATT